MKRGNFILLQMEPKTNKEKNSKLNIVEFAVAFLFPALVGKIILLYFGMNYAAEPGAGYGYGLVFSIGFTILMVSRFIWKYKDYRE